MTKRRPFLGVLAATALIAGMAVTAVAPQAAAAPTTPIETNTAGAPATIPALQNWTPGEGQFQFDNGLRIVAAADQADVASQVAEGLGNALDLTVGVATTGEKAGDIAFTLDEDADELGTEGYELVVSDKISITAATETGLFYGGQTVTQWATLAGMTKYVPGGSTVDVPEFPIRGVGICACIVHVSMEKFEETIREMAYYKMNELWLELKVESEAYPDATFWSYYTTEQARYISELAAEHNIEIVAEVNSPGHMGPWLQAYPELMLVNKNGVPQPTQLDITKPEALDVLTTLADEYFEHFPEMDYWHMGADEYLMGSGSMSDYPQFTEAAVNFTEGNRPGKEIDVFIDFINQINAHVKSKGKQLRIWNDGLKAFNNVELDKDIIVEHWWDYGRSAQDLLNSGYDQVNADGLLYFTRNGPYSGFANNWNRGWTVMDFKGSGVVDTSAPGSGQVLGAKLTLWPDNGPGTTENALFAQSRDTMLLVAQESWGSERPVATAAEFQTLGTKLGRGPNTVLADPFPVPAGTYVIGAEDLFLTPNTSPAKVSATSAESEWTLSTTSDGYYKVASGDLCLVPTGSTELTLNTPQRFGDQPEAQTCAASGAQANLQKWSLKAVDGGYNLVNAITQLPLYVSAEGEVTQDDPNKKTPSAFKFIGDGVSISTDFAGRVLAGLSARVNVVARNLADEGATNVVVTPVLPQGWLVTPASLTIGDLNAQAVQNHTFQITPNAGPAGAEVLAFVTSWTDAAGEARERTTSVPLNSSCAADVTSPSEVVRVSSEQDDNSERSPAINVIDGNANTFWHTQWNGAEPAHSHQLVVGLSEAADLCAVTLTPRQGVSSGAVNGQIKGYELYVTNDRAVAANTTGTPAGVPTGWTKVAEGELPTGQSPQWIPFAEPVNAQFVLLVSKSAQNPQHPWTTLGEFSVDIAGDDTTAPVVVAQGASVEEGKPLSLQVQAADASSVTFAASGLPAGLSLDEATGLISGTTSVVGEHVVSVTVTDAGGLATTVSLTISVTKPAPTPEPSEEPSVKPSPKPSAKPSVTPSTPVVAPFVPTAPYTLAGTYDLNDRQWVTTCEEYSQTERCRTEIWATVVKIVDGQFVRESGWAFNNLTYLPYMTRAAWVGNPLGDLGSTTNGEFTSAGRQWKTECDTEVTGRDGCRSYTMTTVYEATAKPEGGYTFSQSNEWVFNNIVMFGGPEKRG